MARPTGVTILAVLSFIGAFFLLCGGLFAFVGGAAVSAMLNSMPSALMGLGITMVAIFFLGLGALYVVNGIGLLKMQEWARVLTLALVAIGAIFAVLGAVSALVHIRIVFLLRELIVLAIDLFILKYLLSPDIKRAFAGPVTA